MKQREKERALRQRVQQRENERALRQGVQQREKERALTGTPAVGKVITNPATVTRETARWTRTHDARRRLRCQCSRLLRVGAAAVTTVTDEAGAVER